VYLRGTDLLITYDVIVVGAGIFGASTAYHLKRAGAGRVLLLDKLASAGAGTTGASAAIVRQHYSNKVLAAATGRSIQVLRQLEQESGRRGLFCPAGWYFLVPDSALASARENVRMHRALGVATELVDIKTAAPRLPWLKPEGVAAVVFEPKSGYADPVACAEAFVTAFQGMGGETAFHTECHRLVRRENRVLGIETARSQYSAAIVVNACGPWAQKLAATANIDLDMDIYREQETIWECSDAEAMPQSSISDAVDAIYLRPLGDRRYTAGRGFPKTYVAADPDDYTSEVDDEFIGDVLSRLQLRFAPFSNCRYIAGFASLYDVTKDWYPYVGPRSTMEGYADASGGSGHGFKLAPALGRDLAEWIFRGDANEDIRALSYDRISEGRLFVQKYGGNRG
jgi:sarcosine oxidase, subunit beta